LDLKRPATEETNERGGVWKNNKRPYGIRPGQNGRAKFKLPKGAQLGEEKDLLGSKEVSGRGYPSKREKGANPFFERTIEGEASHLKNLWRASQAARFATPKGCMGGRAKLREERSEALDSLTENIKRKQLSFQARERDAWARRCGRNGLRMRRERDNV